jgi:DNA-binding winged helix-turn-helix (wHTH) protein
MASCYRFDDFELDTRAVELRRGNERIRLEPQVFDLLAYLVEHHLRMVPKSELIEHIWPDKYISDAAVASRLMAARKALGDNGRDQRYIRTVHGRGYRFVGTLAAEASAAPNHSEGEIDTPEGTETGQPPRVVPLAVRRAVHNGGAQERDGRHSHRLAFFERVHSRDWSASRARWEPRPSPLC